MRPLPPIPFSDGPAFINILPKRSSSLVITSNQGLVNVVDVLNPNSGSEFYQVNSYVKGIPSLTEVTIIVGHGLLHQLRLCVSHRSIHGLW
jgi:hypothetical protein